MTTEEKEQVATVTIQGKIVYYEEDSEADWVGVEEAIANGQKKGFLYRYRTAIDVGRWWVEKDKIDIDGE